MSMQPNHVRPTVIAAIAVATVLALVGCGKKAESDHGAHEADKAAPAAGANATEKPDNPANEAEHATDEGDGPSDKSAESTAADEPLTVAAAGTEFDPPVDVERIPNHAWYCDMGTVHYARMDKGDGTCPRCKMQLKHLEHGPNPAVR